MLANLNPERYPLIVFIFLVTTCLLLATVWPQLALSVGYVNWLFFAICVGFLITPFGSIRVGEKALASSLRQSFYFILKAQLFVLALYMSLMIALSDVVPAHLVTFHFTISHWGFYPWSLYALVSIAFAYVVYHLRQPVSFNATLQALYPHADLGVMSIGLHVYFRLAALLAIFLSLLIFLIYFAMQATGYLNIDFSHGINIQTLLVFSVLLMPIQMQIGKRFILSLHASGISISGFWLFYFVVFFVMLIAANTIAYVMQEIIAQNYFFNWGVADFPRLTGDFFAWFDLIWWVGWTPVIAWSMARHLVGRTLREIIIMNAVLPSLLLVTNSNIMSFSEFSISKGVIILTSLAGMSLIYDYFRDSENKLGLVSSLQSKYTGRFYVFSLMMFCLLIFAYLLNGFNLIRILGFIIVGPCYLYLFGVATSFVKQLLIHKQANIMN